MGPVPGAEAAPQPEGQAPGNASQKIADVNSGLMEIMDLVQAKFPEDAQKLSQVIQGYQSFVDGLGQPQGAPPPEQPGMGTTTPEAGAEKVRPVL